ncbi:hypothetical protein EfmAA290_17500 [Enterococcus faecium]|nr:hypothetical protein EfmAA290_17500 [Enterococcus faecium]
MNKDRFYRPLNPFRTPLPKVLCFDEFKSVRGVSGAMSFIMMDGQTQRLLDIDFVLSVRKLKMGNSNSYFTIF